MSSGLRAKLRAISAEQVPTSKPNQSGGLRVYTERRDPEPGILDLPAAGLRRIGWNGRTFDVHKCLFLDTETTGLSGGAGTVAFLVGLGYVQEDAFIIEQYLMSDYSDEPELIDRLANRMDGFDSVCTFNGKTFDIPLLEARFTMCRMRHRWREMDQIDLMHPARRTWKMRLGSCRLSQLENLILDISRTNDLPGSEVPQRYFEFLKTGDLSLLEDIIRHNRQDIATLAALLVKLCEIYQEPQNLTERRDTYSVGKALERQGELGLAGELYRTASIPAPSGTIQALRDENVAAMANWRRYLIERKNGNVDKMRAILEQMIQRGQMPFETHIEMAKLEEHRTKDFSSALKHAKKAKELCPDDNAQMSAVDKRIARLEGKIDRTRAES